MASIADMVPIDFGNSVFHYYIDGDPTTGNGVPDPRAGIDSIATRIDTTGNPAAIYRKIGPLATDWVAVSTPGSLSAGQTAAAAGTSGAPSDTNRYVTNADTRLLTTTQTAALAGTSGTPSGANKFVTDSDARLAAVGDTFTPAVVALGENRTTVTASPYVQHNRVFNVRDYGAVGDGVTNDTAAIQAAISAAVAASTASEVRFPGTSTYLFGHVSWTGGNITIDAPHATLKYAGNGVSSTKSIGGGTGLFMHVTSPVRFVLNARHVDCLDPAGVTQNPSPAFIVVLTEPTGLTELVEVVGDVNGGDPTVPTILFVFNVTSGNPGAQRVVVRNGWWTNPGVTSFWNISGAHGTVVVRDVHLSDPLARSASLSGINSGHSANFFSDVANDADQINRLLINNVSSDYTQNDVWFCQAVRHLTIDGVVANHVNQNQAGTYTNVGGTVIKTDDVNDRADRSTLIRNVVARNSNTASQQSSIWITEGALDTMIENVDVDRDVYLSSSGAGDTSFRHTIRNSIVRNTGMIVCGDSTTVENVKLIGSGSQLPTILISGSNVRVDGVRLIGGAIIQVPSSTTVPYTNIRIANVMADATSQFLLDRGPGGATGVQEVAVINWQGGQFQVGGGSARAADPALTLRLNHCSFVPIPTELDLGTKLALNPNYRGIGNVNWTGTAWSTFVADRLVGPTNVDGALTASQITATGALTAASASVGGASTALSYSAPTVTATTTLAATGGVVKLNSTTTTETQALNTAGTAAQEHDRYASLHKWFVGLKGASPTDALDLDASSARFAVPLVASAGVQGQIGIRSVTANTTLAVTDQVVKVDATAGGVVVTVPLASTGSYAWSVMRTDSATANTVTIAASGSDTVVGTATIPVGGWADVVIDNTGKVFVLSPGGAATSIAAANVTPGAFASGTYSFVGPVQITAGSGLTLSSGVNLTANGQLSAFGLVAYRTSNRGNASGVTSLSLSDGQLQMVTLNANWAPTGIGIQAGTFIDLLLTQDATGGRTVTWPAGTVVCSNVSIATVANARTWLRLAGFGPTSPVIIVTQLGTA